MPGAVEQGPERLSRILRDAFVLGPGWDPGALRARPRLRSRWSRPARPYDRSPASADECAAIAPWAVGLTQPRPLDAERCAWQVIVCRGAGLAALQPLLERGHGIELTGPADVLDEAGLRLPAARRGAVALVGGDGGNRTDEEYGPAQIEAERAVTALLRDLPQDLAARAAPYADALTHSLKHAFARALRVTRSVQALPLHAPGPLPLLLVGDEDPRPILAALATRVSTLHVLSGSTDPRHRSAVARLMRNLAGPHAAASVDWPDHLVRQIDEEAARRRPDLPQDAAVIVADLRNRADFRHRETALALIRRCRTRHRPVLLSPFSRATWNTRRNRWEVLRAGGILARVAFVPGFKAAPGRASWRPPLMERLEALPPLAASPTERAALRVASADFIDRELATLLGGALGFEAAFRSAPPAFALLVPGAKPAARLAAIAARRTGVPTIDVQTLLISTAARYEMPLADRVATILRPQAELLVHHFGVPPERVHTVGCHEFELWRGVFAAARRSRLARAGAIVVLSQPLPGQMMAALQMLLSATEFDGGPRIVLHHHPDDPPALRHSVRAALTERIAAGRAEIGARRRLMQDLAHAALAISLSSNAAMRAGALGVPVVTIETDPPQPVRLDAMGLAVAAATAGELREIIQDIVHGTRIRAVLDRGRAGFFAANPSWAEGSAVERIVTLAEAARAGRRRDTIWSWKTA